MIMCIIMWECLRGLVRRVNLPFENGKWENLLIWESRECASREANKHANSKWRK